MRTDCRRRPECVRGCVVLHGDVVLAPSLGDGGPRSHPHRQTRRHRGGQPRQRLLLRHLLHVPLLVRLLQGAELFARHVAERGPGEDHQGLRYLHIFPKSE